MGLFGKTPEKNPKDQVNEWCRKLRKECSALDRQMRCKTPNFLYQVVLHKWCLCNPVRFLNTAIQREEDKVRKSLKDAAKKGDKDVCIILAKEVLRSRKAINKIYSSKAHINSVQMQMKNQLAILRVAGALRKSTEVMVTMQALVRVPEVAASMREMSKEMMKAGIIEEMLDETMSDMEDHEDMEEEAQEEIDKVLWEITQGELGKAPSALTDTISASVIDEPGPSTTEATNEDDLEEMQERLSALRS